ncbi:serine hydrolase domain-containing protein [Streptomyces stackebrandtii]|uniref:serine hydrolase domain-containing protein n=1 Tax=Streptomyces stackebrandtii TaxID=3051177 RepID=UPI0028DB898B|nr:serine hydrolase domain-containing protein [Streptomyces sp. DSM 40976]
MSQKKLARFIAAKATEPGVPGVSVGVWTGDRETFASHGVTSVDTPVPVAEDTLFLVGSVSKSFTATALMRLVADGHVELHAPVRRYVPELKLADERTAAQITVLQLLNHTAGLDWRFGAETGEGDDALAAYVARLEESELIGPPGGRSSYSQTGYNLVGRIIENVTRLPFEQAVSRLLFEPLGMSSTTYSLDEALALGSSASHHREEDGTLSALAPWKESRAKNAGGGALSSMADLMRWARFHLWLGRSDTGARVMPPQVMHRMQQQTVELRGTSLGDAMGIGWFLRDTDGVRVVEHGGSASGQFAELVLVPERDFAVVVASNEGPDSGLALNRAVVRWALEHYLGVIDRDPEPLPHDPERTGEVVGAYANEMMTITIGTDESGLTIACAIKPELRAASDAEMPADLPAAGLGLLPGDGDDYIVTGGGLQGQRGFFTRDDRGAITGADLGGRLFTRVGVDAPATT